MRMQGFQKPTNPQTFKEVGLARISYSSDGAHCSCGWVGRHSRTKVLEDRIDRHLERRHGGRGVRL